VRTAGGPRRARSSRARGRALRVSPMAAPRSLKSPRPVASTPAPAAGRGAPSGEGAPSTPALNSTGEFLMFNTSLTVGRGPEQGLGFATPRDYEIRFTPEGSLAVSHVSQNRRVVRVPFEVWDVGPVGPLPEGDPAQAVRLIPTLYSLPSGDEDPCAVGFGHATRTWQGVSYPVTMSVNGSLPRDGRTYAQWEAAAAAVLGDEACVTPPNTLISANIGSMSRLQQILFLQAPGAEGAWPGEGTRLRFLTAKPGWAAARLAVDLRQEIQSGAFDPASGTAFAQVGDETVPLAPRADWPGIYEGQRVYPFGEVPSVVAVRYGYDHAGETALEAEAWPLNVAAATDLEGVGLDAAYFLPSPFNRVPYELGPFDVEGLQTAQAVGSVVGRAYVLGQPAAPGDVVAAITLRGGAAGAAPVFHLNGEPVVNLLVHGAEGATGEADGVRAGEPFTLHLWDQATGQVRDLGVWLYGWRPYGGAAPPRSRRSRAYVRVRVAGIGGAGGASGRVPPAPGLPEPVRGRGHARVRAARGGRGEARADGPSRPPRAGADGGAARRGRPHRSGGRGRARRRRLRRRPRRRVGARSRPAHRSPVAPRASRWRAAPPAGGLTSGAPRAPLPAGRPR